ncbi:hypothetical protein [Chelativorans sp.]|uniref:hypothetical protein n=1 Tax=Chelativorans sp. TaxID=2203393 RepID=UPI00281153A1|nr:hypothetical protein [Chelativorans sp.]
MSRTNGNLAELRRLLTRAAVVVLVLAAPLIAARAGDDAPVGGVYEKKSAGAGFVLLVALQRAG